MVEWDLHYNQTGGVFLSPLSRVLLKSFINGKLRVGLCTELQIYSYYNAHTQRGKLIPKTFLSTAGR